MEWLKWASPNSLEEEMEEEEEILGEGEVEEEVREGVDESEINVLALKVMPHGVKLIGAVEAAGGLKVVTSGPSIGCPRISNFMWD